LAAGSGQARGGSRSPRGWAPPGGVGLPPTPGVEVPRVGAGGAACRSLRARTSRARLRGSHLWRCRAPVC